MVRRSGTITIPDRSFTRNHEVSISASPDVANNVTAAGFTRCNAPGLSPVLVNMSIWLTRGDGYYNGTNMCSACGTGFQIGSGYATKKMYFQAGREGTWTATIDIQGQISPIPGPSTILDGQRTVSVQIG